MAEMNTIDTSKTHRGGFSDISLVDGVYEFDEATNRVALFDWDDEQFKYTTIGVRHMNRPDIFALDYLTSPNDAWLVTELNGYLDSWDTFQYGNTVRYPTKQEIIRFYREEYQQ